MKCPRCNSNNSYVYESRSKDSNANLKNVSVEDLPRSIKLFDYRVRRHRCRTCAYTFSTVETYFDHGDLEFLQKNVLEGLL